MGLISLCLRSSPTFREIKTGHQSMFNSLPRFFNCLRTESADFCSLNGRTIRTDCGSGVDLRGGAGVCLDVMKLEIIESRRCSGYANCRNKVLRRLHSS